MKTIKLFFILVCFTGILAAQSHHFVNYKERGFSSNQIFSLYQDYHGFLWIGSGVGLTRYDSEQFLHFSVEDSLPANEILALASDDSATLWIGTGLGLSAIDIRDVNQPTYKFSPPELLEEPISTLLYNQGKLWIGTNRGLFIYSASQAESYKISAGKTDKPVKEIKLTAQNKILVLLDDRLELYDSSGGYENTIKIDLNARLKCILPTGDGQTLLGTNHGLYTINLMDHQLKPIFSSELGTTDINRIIENSDGTIWLGSDNGLIKISGETIKKIDKNKGLPGNDLRALLIDNERNLWLGSYTAGLFKLSNPDLLNYAEKEGLRSNVVNCIIPENNQTKLIGTDLGIYKMDGFTLTPDDRFIKLANEIIWFIYIDQQKNIWVGGEGILYIYKNNRLEKVNIEPLKSECTFLDMLQASDGTYWICTTVGLFSINRGEQKGYPQFEKKGIRRVWSANELSDGRLYFSTDNGIAEKTETGFTFISTKDGLPDRGIYHIIEDKNKVIWMAGDRGLIKKDSSGYALYGAEHGLKGTIIAQIMEDANRGIWLCTDKGLQLFNNGQAGYTFSIKDGLLDDEFTTQHSSLIDKNGLFWLGVFGGLTIFNPKERGGFDNAPPVYFAKAEYYSGTTRKSFINGQITKVDYSENNVLFKCRGLYFYNEQSLKYLYKLDGFDSDWTLAQRGDIIRYSNLPFGSYNLLIKAQLENTFSDKINLSQKFIISRPFWLQAWFIILVLFGLLIFAYFLYKLKTKHIRDANRELQSQINRNIRDLALAEATIENIIEHAGSSIITTDLKGRITTWNKRAEEIFGYTKERVLNKSIKLLDQKDDLSGFLSVLSEVKKSGELRQLELKKETADGQVVDLIVTTTALKDKEGRTRLITFSMEDFSERNRLLEYRINREKLLAGIEALNKLLATLSHHINNSIAAISSMAQLAELDSKYNQKFLEVTSYQVRKIGAVLKGLSVLVNQLNLKTVSYAGESGKEKLYDIENEINLFLESVKKLSEKK